MEYIRTNKLRIKSSTGNTLREPTEVRLGSTKKYRLMNGSDVVWDVLQTTFSASNFSIGASGGNVASNSNVTSYGLNALGTKESLNWTCSPTTISANSSTSPKTHTITYTQNDTGDTTTAVCTQDAAALNWTVSSYATTPTVPAGGGTVSVTIHWDLYLNNVYQKSGTSSPSRVWLDGVYQGTSTVSVGSAGTTHYANAHVVGYITNYEFYADGHFFDIYRQDAVYRAANTLGTKTYTYNVSLTKNEPNKTFTSSGGTTKIKATSTRSWSATWSSGSPASDKEDYSATLSATNGTVNKTSVSGTNVEVTLTVEKNGDTDRTITVTATAGSTSKSVSYSQSKRVFSNTSYSEPSVVRAYQDANIPAWGGHAYLMVDWSQTEYTNYDNGTHDSSPVNGTSRAVILGGTIQQTGASLQTDGGIYKNSCGTTVTPQRTVYTISAYYFEANGVGKEVRPVTIHLGQAPNEQMKDPTWLKTYNISITYSPTGNLSNAGGTKTISVDCKENGEYTYTATKYDANAKTPTTRDASATLTTTEGTLNPASITGNGTSTLTVNENWGAQKTITVTAKAGSASKSTSFVQNAVAWAFSAATKTFNVAYNTKTQQISGTSSRNGFYVDIQKNDVSVTGGKLYNDTVTSSGTTFYATISFDENTTNSQRTITAVVTQRRSGSSSEKLTYTIVQAAQPSVVTYVSWVKGTGKYVVGSRYTFSATLKFHKNVNGNTVYITPMKNSTEIMAASAVRLSGTSLDGDYYSQVVSLQVKPQSLGAGEAFYLKAQYGSAQPVTIELAKVSSDPLNV